MIALAIFSRCNSLSLSLSLSLSFTHACRTNVYTNARSFHPCTLSHSRSSTNTWRYVLFFSFFDVSLVQLSILTWFFLCSGVEGGFGVFGREPPVGVQCRSRARAVRSPSVTRLFSLVLAVPPSLVFPPTIVFFFSNCSLLSLDHLFLLSARRLDFLLAAFLFLFYLSVFLLFFSVLFAR